MATTDEAFDAFISTMEDQIVRALDDAEGSSNSSSSYHMFGSLPPDSTGPGSMPQEFAAAKPLPQQPPSSTNSVLRPVALELPHEELPLPPAALAARGAGRGWRGAGGLCRGRGRGRGCWKVPVGAHPMGLNVERPGQPPRAADARVLGPCFLKLLMPRFMAGAVIGKGGSGIADIERSSNCQMQFSKVDDFFPGTSERVVLLSGAAGDLERCLELLLERLRRSVWQEGPQQAVVLKLAVPSSAVSALLGVGGSVVQRLVASTSCFIKVTPRVEEIRERLVILHGIFEAVSSAAVKVCKLLQSNPHMGEHTSLRYDVWLPLGAWEGEREGPKNTGRELLPPERLALKSKRELVEYLQAVAPRQLLARCGLIGSPGNIVKAKRKEDLLEAVAETWQARGAGRAA